MCRDRIDYQENAQQSRSALKALCQQPGTQSWTQCFTQSSSRIENRRPRFADVRLRGIISKEEVGWTRKISFTNAEQEIWDMFCLETLDWNSPAVLQLRPVLSSNNHHEGTITYEFQIHIIFFLFHTCKLART